MSSFWDRVDKVNQQKKEDEEKEKKEQSGTSSSFWDRVDKINNGEIKVNTNMSSRDATDWSKGAYDVAQRSVNFLKTDGYKLDDKYGAEIDSYLDRADYVAQYLRANKNDIEDYDTVISSHYDTVNSLKRLREGIGQSNKFYSQWETEDDYKTAVAAQKDYDEKAAYDLEAGKKEIEELEKQKAALAQKYRGIITGDQAAITYLTGPNGSPQTSGNYIGKMDAAESDVISQIKKLDEQIQQKKQYLTLAERIQTGIKLSGVADPTSELYDPEFGQYSGYVSTESNDWHRGLTTKFGMGYDDLTYEYINGDDAMRSDIFSKAVSWKADTDDYHVMDQMNKNEIAIYNYYYAKDGKKAAEEYLDNIRETLNAREANERFENMKGKTGLELLFGIEAGLDQFESGVKNLFNTKDDYIPQSSTQILTGMVREDLADDSIPIWYNFKTGKWEDQVFGSSVGQGVYDLTTTTTNMAPSILTSAVVGMINPTAGAWTGAALMGGSAAGNAYSDALNRGFDKKQAATYGVAIGVSEALLEKALGGISAFGGTSAKLTKAVAGIDNALLRWSLRYGGSMLSEGLEEGLQEILDPIFQNAIMGTDEDINWEEVAYSALLGGLSAGALELGGTIRQTKVEQSYKTKYDGSVDELIQEGLESDIKSESFQLATQYKAKTDAGKNLTGAEIRNMVEANEKQFAVEDFNTAKSTAEKRLTELGESNNIKKIADLAAKRATGQKLTRSEKSTLARSQYGAQVAKEMQQETQPDSGSSKPFDTSYKITYKSLDERIGTEGRFGVSETGKSIVRDTGKEVDIDTLEFKTIEKDKVKLVTPDGTVVDAGWVDWADDSQSYLVSAVSAIENITPESATDIIRIVDRTKPLGAQMNAIDEAFTYGYYNYSQNDLMAGEYVDALTNEQLKKAYELGKTARKNSDNSKAVAYKQMRTAAQAQAEKTASKSKNMTITYNKGNGEVVSIDEAGIKDAKRSGAVGVAKILHKLGLGTRVDFFESFESKTKMVKDRKTGKMKPARVFINDQGVEQIAYSGVYRKSDGTIRVDLNAYNGKGLTLNALAHELTHFIQQWSDKKYKILADFLVKTYEGTDMTMHERVLREQKRLEDIRGEDVSYDEAFDEVVANAMSKMFDDGKLVERLTELKAQDEKLAKKLWEGFKKIMSKFLGIYQESPALFKDAADLVAMKNTFEQLQNMFAEALVEASDNYQASLTVSESETLSEAGIGFDEETKSVYSLHFSTAYQDVIQVGKKQFDTDAIAQIVAKGTNRSIEDARKWVQSEMTIANIVMANPEFLDFEADNRYEAIKKNSDYPQGTVDLSNLCPKREEFTTMFDMLQKKYPNKLFTAQDIAEMRKILAKNDITVACGACFVEDRRQLIGEIADTFSNMWKEAVESGKPLQKINAEGKKSDLLVTKALAKQYGLTAGSKIMATDTYIPNQYDLTTYEGFKLLEKNHPTIAMAFNRYNNSRGQQSARLIEGRAEYNRQILGWSDAKVRSVNNNGGLRIFSFSDFEVVHLLDLVQVIIDCAAKGVKIQGYTKIPAFAKLVRGTGIKLNRSLIPKGDYGFHMEDGKVVLDYDTTEGIDINDKNFIDESGNPDVGNIVIGINPTQIGAAMLDPFIDYIIPFHSNKAKEILRKLGTGEWVNYKESQHEKDISTGKASKHNVNIYTEVINKYHPTNKVEFVEAFLKECKRQGKIPRYAEFLNVDANGDYAYREGYHKLLVDFKMFDAEGNILPQGNITPSLDDAFMAELLNAEIDRKQNYEFPQEVYDDIDKKFGEQYSSQETDLDENGNSVYDGGKKETQQEDKANVRREETREAFNRRANETVRTVRKRGEITCAYNPVVNQTERAGRTEKELKKLGIQVIVHEGLETNVNGITMVILGDSTSVAGDAVYVRNSMTTDPVETAGHEAYHFWKHNDARSIYTDVVVDNIDFASDAFIEFEKKIADAYFGEEVGIEDDGADKLEEEIFAYITGLIHAGDSNNIVRPFLRDYDAVKAAWDDLIKKQATQKGQQYSSQETDLDNAPTFYSKMGKVVDGMKQEKFGASSVISMLRGRGVKAEEIRWSGIQAFLDGKKSVTKQELLDFINGSMLHVEEETRTQNSARDEFIQAWMRLIDYFVDENEILAGLNDLEMMEGYLDSLVWDEDLNREDADYILDLAKKAGDSKALPTKWDQYKLDGGTNYRELVFRLPDSTYSNNAMKAHWGNDAQGVLAHARIQDFDTLIGRMLFIEEIQSDWHNAGHKQGYFIEGDKVTVNNTELRHENGWYNLYHDGKDLHQGVSETFLKQRFTNGITEEEIHDGLVDEYNRAVEHSGKGWKAPDAPFKDNYHEFVLKRLLRMAAEEGYDSIGWTTAEIQSQRWSEDYAEGYRIEYDQDIPKFLKKYGKQWDTTVGKTELDNGTEVWSMAITDAMKKSVLTEGQEMYSEHDLPTLDSYDGKTPTKRELWDDISTISLRLSALERDFRKAERGGYTEQIDRVRGRLADAKENYIEYGEYLLENYEKYSLADIRSLSRALRLTDSYSEQAKYTIEQFKKDLSAKVDEYRKDAKKALREETKTMPQEDKKLLMSLKLMAAREGYDMSDLDIGSEATESTHEDDWLLEGDALFSEHDTDYSNRSLLANAFETLSQNSEEYKMIQEYKGRIRLLNEQEEKLSKLNAEIRDIRFGKGKYDAEKLKQLEAKAKNVAKEITRQDRKLLDMEASGPLRGVIEQERKKEAQKTKAHVQETQKRKKERAEQAEYRHKIKNFKKKLEGKLLRPTDRQYVPVDLIKAMVDVCEIIDTDTDLYKADGSINKAQVKRNDTKEKLQNLKEAYENLKDHSDPIYAGEFDEMVYTYLKELKEKFSDKSLNEMSLDELSEMYEILVAIDETLADARKLIGWGDAENVYEAGDAIVAEQNAITQKRKNGKRNAAQKGLDKVDNLSLSPVRNVERMSAYNQDSFLLKMFKKFEQGIRKKNKFKMDAYKKFESLTTGKEYDDAIYKEVGGKKYTDIKGRKFGISKMQMMQAILSWEREQANKNMHHIENGGFTFADLDKLRKGNLKDAVSAENSHRVPAAYGMVAEFNQILKDDKWCQDYMKAAREFFNGMAKDAVNETSIALKHRIIAKDKNYIPFEVDTNFVNTEITDMDAIQKTINSYGMLKETADNAPQPLYITGLNNILDRHIEQVGNIYGLAIDVRNFNKVWNVRSKDDSGNNPTVKESIDTNWGKEGVRNIEQAVKDIQGPRVRERNALYDKVKSGYIGATFLLNLSVVTKQIGSMHSSVSMLKWRDPARMMGNLIYTMANHKKISAEVDKYTATAWMRRQGMSDAELHTLMTEGKKTLLGRTMAKAPAIVNPTKWITAMDHAVALSLWKYAKQDTAKRTGLKGEELLKATAEFYDEVVENTQSMTDVLHRPEIQKRGDVLSESVAMFKTDLYQMAGQLQATAGRFMANKSKENGKALARTMYSIAMSALWGSLMTTVFALLRYKVKQYRDDDDDELTAESWLKRQGIGLAGDLMGYVFPLLGSEAVGAFENIMYGETDDVVDNVAITAVNDLYDMMITVGTSIKDGEMPDAAAWKKLSAKALQAFYIPANNILRAWEAIDLHAQDIANGEFFSFNAGIDSKTDKLYNAIVRGDTAEAAKLKSSYTDKNGNYDNSKYESALKTALRENDSRIHDAAKAGYEGNSAERNRIYQEIKKEGKFAPSIIIDAINSELSKIRGEVEPEKVTSQYNTDNFVDAIILGEKSVANTMKQEIISTHIANGKTKEEAEKEFKTAVTSSVRDAHTYELLSDAEAKKMLQEYAGKDEEEATSKVNYWVFCEKYPKYEGLFNETRVAKYNEYAKPAGISVDMYARFLEGTNGLADKHDKWGDVEVTKREQVLEVIDSLPITWQQKDALYLAADYAESKIWDVPW